MMIVAVLAAIAVVVGTSWLAVGIGVVAALHPLLFLGGIVVVVLTRLLRRRQASNGSAVEAGFLRAVAAELRSGASLRHALAAAADTEPRLPLDRVRRLAAAGAPFARIATGMEEALAHNGRLVGAVLAMTDRIGGEASVLFARLASISDESAALERERVAATAQARFSAAVVVGAPLVFTALVLASGGDGLFVGPGLLLAGTGLVLQMFGIGVVVAMLWRSR